MSAVREFRQLVLVTDDAESEAEMTRRIQVRAQVLQEILDQAVTEMPIECCGLLAGRDGVITTAIPATNFRSSKTAYEIAARELFEMFMRMREQALDHLGIYHSHPHGENVPSPSDIEQAYYSSVAYFIISPTLDAMHPVRAFSIADGQAEELGIDVVA